MPQSAGFAKTHSPVLFNNEVNALFNVNGLKDRVARLDVTFDVSNGAAGLETAVKELTKRAKATVEEKSTKVLILTDRGVNSERVAIPMLLAVGAVHQALVRSGLRLKCDIVAETGEARDVHQIACLLGFGANAVNPYIALSVVKRLADDAEEEDQKLDDDQAFYNYRSAIEKGLLKIMAKMGISTLSSYCRAQIFEAIGLSQALVDDCFLGTPTPIGGIGYNEIGEEAIIRHQQAFGEENPELTSAGYYKVVRKGGEFHAWNPKVVGGMHRFLKKGQKEDFDNYQEQSDNHQPYAIKDLLKIKFPESSSTQLEQVEPIEDIRRRFTTAAMSLGALSPECHETIAIAMNRIGGKSNSGEGGEDPRRYSLLESGDNASSAIKQVASGRFGVTAEYLSTAKEIEIKMAQGAKPGEGGQLPGHKVSPMIAPLAFQRARRHSNFPAAPPRHLLD